MSAHRSRRLGRHAAEQILRDPAAGDHVLNDLLTAATAPARESELAGEHAAVAAYRASHIGPVPTLRRPSVIKTTLAKMLAAKLAVAAVATAAATVGGVAVVATTTNLPSPLPSPPSGSSTVAPSTSDAASTTASESSKESQGTGAGNSGGPSTTPSPSLVGLCHAYTAGAGAEHGKALENPAFTVLITTAGGKDRVAAYCAKVLAEPSGKPATTTAGAADEHAGKAHSTEDPNTKHSTGPPMRPSH